MLTICILNDEDTKPWVPYCVESVKQFMDVDVVPLNKYTGVDCPKLSLDYLGLHVDLCTDSEYIGLMYPNFIPYRKFDILSTIVDSKPSILCDTYSSLSRNSGGIFKEVQNWKKSTEHILGIDNIQYEFARALPIVYPRWVFSKVREQFSIDRDYFNNLDNPSVPEAYKFNIFNVLGSYLYYFHRESINWVDMSSVKRLSPFLPPVKSFFDSVLDTEEVHCILEEQARDTSNEILMRKHFKSLLGVK